jgi:tetratricopeptide (TPR) repeat protein
LVGAGGGDCGGVGGAGAGMTPTAIQQALAAGRAHHEAGRLDQATAIYDRVLGEHPGNADALYLRGAVAQQRGRAEEAIELMQRAVALKPGVGAYQVGLGAALAKAGRLDESVAALRRAVALNGGDGEAQSNLSLALGRKGLRAEALAAARRAVEISPVRAEFWSNLGLALKEEHQVDGAVGAFERALTLRADLASAWTNLGSVLSARGDHERAMEAFRRSVALRPDSGLAHLNLSSGLLLKGEFAEGWKEYEWRWRVPQSHEGPRGFAQREWQGEELGGKRILLYGEQGFGDVIQFLRYVPMVAARGGRVIVECYPELARLIGQQKYAGVEEVVVRGGKLPEFDVQCSLMSLPGVMGTTMETVPGAARYLTADSETVESWRARLGEGLTVGLTVGLVWAGKSRPDPLRTVGLGNMGALLDVPGVRFISLQKGEGAEEVRDVAGCVADWTAELGDFADTAALISCLDLVITIDTAVAHLAGALGKATWVLLPFAPTWRWMLDRSDCPWYPTMRLFRQKRAGDWSLPVGAAAAALAELAGKGRG